MDQNALRYRRILLFSDVTDVNNTMNSSQERWQHDLRVTRVTLAGVTRFYAGYARQSNPGSGWRPNSKEQVSRSSESVSQPLPD